jgi:3',5'-cyclic AMP phosphodiesterase CpdA
MTILHISDLHFGPPYVPRVGAALRAAAGVVEPDVIVASGDFTQRAREEQFAEARAYLDSLPAVPVLVTPGNHDVPLYRIFERIFDPYRHYRTHIRAELDYVFRAEGAVFVMLNSTAPLRAITNGRISGDQLEFARREFATAGPDDLKVVVAHHHFAPAPDYEGGEVMPRAKRAIDAFTDLEVDLILGGHLHRAYVGNSLDVYPGEDRVHGITIVQSGTSTSRRGRAREREKNSFNVIRVTDEVIRITHYMYFDDAEGFASVSRHLFPRSPVSFFRDSVTLDAMGEGA